MNARLALSMPLLFLATCTAAFAPAPVYKEPPKPARPSLEKAMQGTWGRSPARPSVRIEGKTWTPLSAAPKRAGRVALAFEIRLDTRRDPAAFDLTFGEPSQVMMRGIVKMDGDRLIFCYTRRGTEADRPKAFTDTVTENGLRVTTMKLIRVEPSDDSP